jgi:hypothetical protein
MVIHGDWRRAWRRHTAWRGDYIVCTMTTNQAAMILDRTWRWGRTRC